MSGFSRTSSDIAERFESSERRLREGLSKDFDERFAASEQRLTQVIVQQLETAQQHLEGRLQVHMEDLKGLVTTTAEAYGGTLDGIERKLGEMNEMMETKFSDHDKALANHDRRVRKRRYPSDGVEKHMLILDLVLVTGESEEDVVIVSLQERLARLTKPISKAERVQQ